MNTTLHSSETLAVLIQLLRAAVTGDRPELSPPDETALRDLERLAGKHSLTAAAAVGLEKAGIRDAAFHEAFVKSLRKVLALEADKTALLRQMEEQNIWYMPLKGAVLKDDYPRLGVREMSDYDILYDETRAADVRGILTGMGYTVDEYNMHNVDSYVRPPVCRFEMHRKLFSPYQDDRLYAFYRDVKTRLIRDDGSLCGWHFSHEDFYVYMLAHEYKHYMAGGSGLRFLLDTWVFLRRYEDVLNWDLVREDLRRLGILDFEAKNRALSCALFEGEALTAEQKQMLDYMLASGTFGTVDNAVCHQVARLGGGLGGKLRYAGQRILIPAKTLESAYPFFYRHRILLPALYVYRLWKGIFRSRKKLAAEIRTLLHRDSF